MTSATSRAAFLLITTLLPACDGGANDVGLQCPMERLTGAWQLQYVVTGVGGDLCSPCDPPSSDCEACCGWLSGFLPADVTGFFRNTSSGTEYHLTWSTIAPPDCQFLWRNEFTTPRAGSTVQHLTLVQRTETKLVGSAGSSTNAVWGTGWCNADVTVSKL